MQISNIKILNSNHLNPLAHEVYEVYSCDSAPEERHPFDHQAVAYSTALLAAWILRDLLYPNHWFCKRDSELRP